MNAGVSRLAILAAHLQPEPLDPSQVVAGDPRTSNHTLSASADGLSESGVWACTPGVFSDVEVAETFVVIAGRATIEPEGGEPIDVAPGDLCVLEAGTRTVWTIHERLVKAYQLQLPGRDDR